MSLSVARKLHWLSSYAAPTKLVGTLVKTLYQYGLADASRLTLPDFLCVGFRKTGTTWLYENLFLHPELYLPPYKNVRYFSRDFAEPLKSYAHHFASGGARLKGDFSNSYSFISRRRVRFVRAVMPEAKLIFLLRNPVERAWSEFVHKTKERERPLSDFAEAEIMRFLENDPVVRAGGYTATVDMWLEAFPPEQIFVGFYEDLSLQPQRLLTDVFRFLGVSADVDWSVFPYDKCIIPPAGRAYEHCDAWRGVTAPEHRNSAELLEGRFESLLREMLRPELHKLVERFGPRVEPWLEE